MARLPARRLKTHGALEVRVLRGAGRADSGARVPSWVAARAPGEGPFVTTRTAGGRWVSEELTVTVGEVCRKCNEGWLSRLEERVKASACPAIGAGVACGLRKSNARSRFGPSDRVHDDPRDRHLFGPPGRLSIPIQEPATAREGTCLGCSARAAERPGRVA